jgi:hypothetical protein
MVVELGGRYECTVCYGKHSVGRYYNYYIIIIIITMYTFDNHINLYNIMLLRVRGSEKESRVTFVPPSPCCIYSVFLVERPARCFISLATHFSAIHYSWPWPFG